MKLSEELVQVLTGKSARFDEAQTKQFIIYPVLQQLGFAITSREEVWPEYRVGQRKFDIVLRNNSSPKCVIEAKRLGTNLSAHKKQLLEYAFESGIEIAILTDGKQWWFYLPTASGNWSNRFVEALNLTHEDDVVRLHHFLEKSVLFSGQSKSRLESAKGSREERVTLKAEIPSILASMPVEEPVFLELAKFIASQSKCSVATTKTELHQYLTSLVSSSTQEIKMSSVNKHTQELLPAVTVRLYKRRLVLKEASYSAIAAAILVSLGIFYSRAVSFSKPLQAILKKYYNEEVTTLGALLRQNKLQSYKAVKSPQDKIPFSPKSRYLDTTIQQLVKDLQNLTSQ